MHNLSGMAIVVFFEQETEYEMRISDWSSDVCSSDLNDGYDVALPLAPQDRLPPAPYAYQQLKDPAQEKRAKALMEELRCLVCQGQSIADSDAPLAGDMRHEVRSKIAAGESPGEIKAWLVARYGNWVSYEQPFDGEQIGRAQV